MDLLGIVLVLIGIAFLLLGLSGAARAVFTDLKDPRAQSLDVEKWAKLVTALTELVRIAPAWVLMTLAGAALIGWGSVLLSGS